MKRAFSILVIIAVVIILVSSGFTGCASQSSPAPSTSAPSSAKTPAPATTAPASKPAAEAAPIKVGVLISLTGTDAVNSPGQQASLQYRLDQAGGQVAGRKIQLIIEDDATDPVVAGDKVRKLLQSDNVDVVMGGMNSVVAGTATNMMKTIQTPLILFMPKSKTILDLGANNFYLPFGTNLGTGYYSGLYASQKLGFKTATVIHQDMVGAMEFVNGSIAGFEKGGGTIAQKQAIPSTTADFSPYLSTMKQADTVIFWFVPLLAQRFVTQYFSAGLKMPLSIAYTSVMSPKLLSDIGDNVIGMVGPDMYTNLIDTPANKEYVANFNQKYGADKLSSMSVGSDICLSFYLEAVKATNGDTSPAKINEALHKAKVNTQAGTFSFTPAGLGIGDLYMLKAVKVSTGVYGWSPFDKYAQVALDAPK
jgi:branched-chain amino acid transport system substrate-binding protein